MEGLPVTKVESRAQRATVLVVDDIADMRATLRLGLSLYGYRAIEAPNARAALDWLEHNRCLAVITDFNMPGMSGGELIGAIRSNPARAALPIVLMSAYESSLRPETGADAFMRKPFSLSALAAQLDVFRAGAPALQAA